MRPPTSRSCRRGRASSLRLAPWSAKVAAVSALDVDAPSDDHTANGIAALALLVRRHGPIPPRPMTRSGGGRYALFFAIEVKRSTGNRLARAWDRPATWSDLSLPSAVKSASIAPALRLDCGAVGASPPDAPTWLLKAVAPPVAPPVCHVTKISPTPPSPPPTLCRSGAAERDQSDCHRRARAAQRHAEQGDVRSSYGLLASVI